MFIMRVSEEKQELQNFKDQESYFCVFWLNYIRIILLHNNPVIQQN